MIAVIVGASPDVWLPSKLEGALFIGVDRGALVLINEGFKVDVAIGDFDSVSDSEFALIEKHVDKIISLPRDKDMTDTEAAIEYVIGQGDFDIRLFGTLGGRLDHEFASTVLLLRYAKRGISIDMVNSGNCVKVVACGDHEIVTTHGYVSFFALGGLVSNLKLVGFKYNLQGYNLESDDPLCVSNEIVSESVKISFDSGYLLIIESSD